MGSVSRLLALWPNSQMYAKDFFIIRNIWELIYNIILMWTGKGINLIHLEFTRQSNIVNFRCDIDKKDYVNVS